MKAEVRETGERVATWLLVRETRSEGLTRLTLVCAHSKRPADQSLAALREVDVHAMPRLGSTGATVLIRSGAAVSRATNRTLGSAALRNRGTPYLPRRRERTSSHAVVSSPLRKRASGRRAAPPPAHWRSGSSRRTSRCADRLLAGACPLPSACLRQATWLSGGHASICCAGIAVRVDWRLAVRFAVSYVTRVQVLVRCGDRCLGARSGAATCRARL